MLAVPHPSLRSYLASYGELLIRYVTPVIILTHFYELLWWFVVGFHCLGPFTHSGIMAPLVGANVYRLVGCSADNPYTFSQSVVLVNPYSNLLL